MVIPPIKFLPHLYTDSSLNFVLESLSCAKQELKNALAYPDLEAGRQGVVRAQELHEAIVDYLSSPLHTPPTEPNTKGIQFPTKQELIPRKTQQTLRRGECTELIKTVETASIDCIITDPPYSQGQTSNGQRGTYEDLSMVKPFFRELAQEYARVLKDTGEGYMFIDWRGFALLYECLSPYLAIRNLIVWDKKSGVGNHYGFSHEFIVFFTKKNYSPNKSGMNVWREAGFSSGAKVTDGEKLLVAQKPLAIIQHIIHNGCPQYGTVLDTFVGSGTTAIACKQTQRNFIGFELNAKTFQIAVERCKREAEQETYFCM